MEHEDFIDKYLKGTLTAIETEQFESLLENSTIFKRNVDMLKDLAIVSGTEDRHLLRKSMANFESKIASETKVVPLLPYKKWLIAASIALLAIIGGITVLNPFAVDTQKLYANNFKPYKNVVTPIVRGENDQSEEFIAFTTYENKNYELAAVQFDSLFSTTKRPYFLLYQANSLLACDQIKEAIPILEKHIASKDELSERGKWYLALAYVKEERKEEAVFLLQEIIRKGSFKKGAAEKLLKKLD